MKFTVTILGIVVDAMETHFQSRQPNEAAGYAFGRVCKTAKETRVILREFWPVQSDELLAETPVGISIPATSYTRALRHADESRQCFWFVHSHPEGVSEFSGADDLTEPGLFETAYVRIGHEGPHGSLIFPANGIPKARVWLLGGKRKAVEKIRVIGRRIWVHTTTTAEIPVFFDRQVRAFGENVQRLLSAVHVGVVGCGGTGSAVCEQLMRLGVGTISVFDGQTFEKSNVNRVYGSGTRDEGKNKVEIMRRLARRIGVGTKIAICKKPVFYEEAARRLVDVDVLFGCTDDEYGRSILNNVALRYGIPLFDVGVKITSENSVIESIIGRVTTVQPGNACLLCRRRILPARIQIEALHAVNPEQAEKLIKEGYAPELETRAPAVVSFTTPTAAAAVNEFLNKVTGFMGNERTSTEVLLFFDRDEVGRNSTAPSDKCKCSSPAVVGAGDCTPFLGVTWGL